MYRTTKNFCVHSTHKCCVRIVERYRTLIRSTSQRLKGRVNYRNRRSQDYFTQCTSSQRSRTNSSVQRDRQGRSATSNLWLHYTRDRTAIPRQIISAFRDFFHHTSGRKGQRRYRHGQANCSQVSPARYVSRRQRARRARCS